VHWYTTVNHYTTHPLLHEALALNITLESAADLFVLHNI
jgi:hypothetical protein